MVRKRVADDMLSPRQLSFQYLQRYREHADIDDVLGGHLEVLAVFPEETVTVLREPDPSETSVPA